MTQDTLGECTRLRSAKDAQEPMYHADNVAQPMAQLCEKGRTKIFSNHQKVITDDRTYYL